MSGQNDAKLTPFGGELNSETARFKAQFESQCQICFKVCFKVCFKT